MFEVLSSSATLINPQVTSAFNDLIASALRFILLLASGVAGLAFKAWYRNQTSFAYKAAASMFVKFAEQKLNDKSNQEKFAYVAQQMSSKYPRLGSVDVEHLIEEAVHDLGTQLENK